MEEAIDIYNRFDKKELLPPLVYIGNCAAE
jgi:hypothetical protein